MKEIIFKKLQQKPYFLVLLPLFFILHGYNDFFGFFTLKFTALHLTAVLFFTSLLYLTAAIYFRNQKTSALFSFWILLLLLTFGSVHDFIKKTAPGFFSSYTFLLPLIILLVILMIVLLKRSSSLYFRTFTFLNLVMITFLIYEFSDGLQRYMTVRKEGNLLDNRFTALKDYKPSIPVSAEDKPDIYFLVFDAMPSTKAMKAEWNYDNGLLDSFLLREKFFISYDSKSNYNLTVLSISSTLNMDYTPPVDLKQDETKMYFKASASILKNSLTEILSKEEYNIRQYQPVSFNNKDWNGKLFFGDMLYMQYFYQTMPGRIYRDLGWHFFTYFKNEEETYNSRNKFAEADLQQTIQLLKKSCDTLQRKPKFVYAHFQLPHDPYIFDSTGKRKPGLLTAKLKEEDQPKAFIEQVKFANILIKDLVTYIKKNNRKNSVILIEGDHGYRNLYGKKGYMIFDNLNVIYYPDQDYKMLYPFVSPVNNFRSVLNKFFHARLPILKDSSIFIPYTLPGEKN